MIFSNFDKIETVDYDTHIRLRWLMYFYYFFSRVHNNSLFAGHRAWSSDHVLSLSHPYFSICIFYLFIFFLLLLCVCIYSYEQDDADASFSQDSEDLTEKRKKREIRLDIGEGNSWNVVMPFAPHTHGALAGNEEIRTRVCVCV